MILQRLVISIGLMTVSYAISLASHTAAKSLEKSGKLKLLFHILVFIYLITSMTSLFVGLYMYFHNEEEERLRQKVEELTKSQQNSNDQIKKLTSENMQLRAQLRHVATRPEDRFF